MTRWLIDTGPLVAYLSERDAMHSWALPALTGLDAPFLTCEPVLAETAYLLAKTPAGIDRLFELLGTGTLQVASLFPAESAAVHTLMRRYADLPMDFTDACLVRLSELHPRARLITVDTDFKVYRRHGRQSIPLLAPWKQ